MSMGGGGNWQYRQLWDAQFQFQHHPKLHNLPLSYHPPIFTFTPGKLLSHGPPTGTVLDRSSQSVSQQQAERRGVCQPSHQLGNLDCRHNVHQCWGGGGCLISRYSVTRISLERTGLIPVNVGRGGDIQVNMCVRYLANSVDCQFLHTEFSIFTPPPPPRTTASFWRWWYWYFWSEMWRSVAPLCSSRSPPPNNPRKRTWPWPKWVCWGGGSQDRVFSPVLFFKIIVKRCYRMLWCGQLRLETTNPWAYHSHQMTV